MHIGVIRSGMHLIQFTRTFVFLMCQVYRLPLQACLEPALWSNDSTILCEDMQSICCMVSTIQARAIRQTPYWHSKWKLGNHQLQFKIRLTGLLSHGDIRILCSLHTQAVYITAVAQENEKKRKGRRRQPTWNKFRLFAIYSFHYITWDIARGCETVQCNSVLHPMGLIDWSFCNRQDKSVWKELLTTATARMTKQKVIRSVCREQKAFNSNDMESISK